MAKKPRKMEAVLTTYREGRARPRYRAAWIDSELGISYHETARHRTRPDAVAAARAWLKDEATATNGGAIIVDVTAAWLKEGFGTVADVWHREAKPKIYLQGDGQHLEYFIVRDVNERDVAIYGRDHRARTVPANKLDDCLTDLPNDRGLVGWRRKSSAERHARRYNEPVRIVEIGVP